MYAVQKRKKEKGKKRKGRKSSGGWEGFHQSSHSVSLYFGMNWGVEGKGRRACTGLQSQVPSELLLCRDLFMIIVSKACTFCAPLPTKYFICRTTEKTLISSNAGIKPGCIVLTEDTALGSGV